MQKFLPGANYSHFVVIAALSLAVLLGALTPAALAYRYRSEIANYGLPLQIDHFHIGTTTRFQTLGVSLRLARSLGGVRFTGNCAYRVSPVVPKSVGP